jgi:predicted GNAT family acetyltransferase
VTTDKTGAPTTVIRGKDKFKISVGGQTVGLAAFVDRGKQRVFTHTEVDDNFEGRGLATILITEALDETKAEGLRVVAVCPMVAAFLDKHHEFGDVRDPITDDIEDWLLNS